MITAYTSNNEPFTEILNNWVVNNDLHSANQLRSMIYHHLKSIVKKQIACTKKTNHLAEQLPNTTSLLHEVLVQLTPPKEIFKNREQFYLSLAQFVRWVLLDDLKAKNAQKRVHQQEYITEFLPIAENLEPYILFDNALSKLEKLSPRSYKVALLHYFLGYEISDIGVELTLNKSTIYNELSTAKAYLRTQC